MQGTAWKRQSFLISVKNSIVPPGKQLPETHLDQPQGALRPQPLLGILPETRFCIHTCWGCSVPTLPSPLHPGPRWDGFPRAQADGGSSQSPSESIRFRGCLLHSAPSCCCFPAPDKHSPLSLCTDCPRAALTGFIS